MSWEQECASAVTRWPWAMSDSMRCPLWCACRRHEVQHVMVCYYPQRVTLEMGPTELLPGSQYYIGDSERAHYSRGHLPAFGQQMQRSSRVRAALPFSHAPRTEGARGWSAGR